MEDFGRLVRTLSEADLRALAQAFQVHPSFESKSAVHFFRPSVQAGDKASDSLEELLSSDLSALLKEANCLQSVKDNVRGAATVVSEQLEARRSGGKSERNIRSLDADGKEELGTYPIQLLDLPAGTSADDLARLFAVWPSCLACSAGPLSI